MSQLRDPVLSIRTRLAASNPRHVALAAWFYGLINRGQYLRFTRRWMKHHRNLDPPGTPRQKPKAEPEPENLSSIADYHLHQTAMDH
jgi:hypothetical protein